MYMQHMIRPRSMIDMHRLEINSFDGIGDILLKVDINVRGQFVIPVFTYRVTDDSVYKSIELMEYEYAKGRR